MGNDQPHKTYGTGNADHGSGNQGADNDEERSRCRNVDSKVRGGVVPGCEKVEAVRLRVDEYGADGNERPPPLAPGCSPQD